LLFLLGQVPHEDNHLLHLGWLDLLGKSGHFSFAFSNYGQDLGVAFFWTSADRSP